MLGAGCREPNPRFRRWEKNVLDMPSYRSGHYTQNAGSEVFVGILPPPRRSNFARPTAAKNQNGSSNNPSSRIPAINTVSSAIASAAIPGALGRSNKSEYSPHATAGENRRYATIMKATGHCPRNAVDKSTRKAREHIATIVSAARLAAPIGAAFAMCGTRMTCLDNDNWRKQAIALIFRLLSINSRSARLSMNALKWRILGALWRLPISLCSLDCKYTTSTVGLLRLFLANSRNHRSLQCPSSNIPILAGYAATKLI
jgi:hypothetical protein